ncbi:MAG: ATP-binding protein [Ignavibacteriales bacterium]|nr:ATP-binding protein [Ignavibacteriales bacterium]
MRYIHRTIEKTLRQYLATFPCVGLTGPRQSGKSTMVKKLLAGQYRYVSFDDHDNVREFYEDPKKFMRRHTDRVVFDEIQRVPEIFNYVKLAVDEDRQRKGKFVLTGSSQFAFMRSVTESLAGRIGLLSLLPFEYREIPSNLREESIYRGAYPELVISSYAHFKSWYSAYIDTYLHRDVRDLGNVGELRDFRRCLQLLATRTAQLLNMSDVARDLGVAVNTVKRWISILEASYIIFLLPPFYKNLGKRITKSPKLYFFDAGLVSFLTGINGVEVFEQGPMYGALFENYVVSEIMKRQMNTKADSELFYFRTSNGVEIDLILDRKTEREYFEIKASESYRSEMTRPIETLKRESEQGFLLYRGKGEHSTPDLQIINYRKYLEQ